MQSYDSHTYSTECRKRVLLVEDDNAVRGFLSEILSAEGYEVLEARDGEEALRRSSEEPGAIHLLITDLAMPRMSGAQVAQQLMLSRPNMKILIITGYSVDHVKKQVSSDDIMVMQKPFSVNAIIRNVRSAICAELETADQFA